MSAVKTTSPEAAKNLRADAQRNRARVLEAAEELLGSEGLAVPIDDIAEKAGVGIGTVYRQFPTKEALHEAIVVSHFERLVADARSLTSSDDPAGALFDLITRIVQEAVSKRDLADALAGAGIDFKATAHGFKHDLELAVGELLTRAQRAGTVRTDVQVEDVMGLIAGACMATERYGGNAGSPARMLEVVCDGLREPINEVSRPKA